MCICTCILYKSLSLTNDRRNDDQWLEIQHTAIYIHERILNRGYCTCLKKRWRHRCWPHAHNGFVGVGCKTNSKHKWYAHARLICVYLGTFGMYIIREMTLGHSNMLTFWKRTSILSSPPKPKLCLSYVALLFETTFEIFRDQELVLHGHCQSLPWKSTDRLF